MTFENISVKTYTGKEPRGFYVYALSKGQNAGKPSRQPFANSFAIQCQSEEHAHVIFSVLFSLHCARAYESNLRGTCIPFITVREFQKVFFRALALASSEDVIKAVKKIALLRQLVDQKQQQKDLCENLLRKYAQSIFREALQQSNLLF